MQKTGDQCGTRSEASGFSTLSSFDITARSQERKLISKVRGLIAFGKSGRYRAPQSSCRLLPLHAPWPLLPFDHCSSSSQPYISSLLLKVYINECLILSFSGVFRAFGRLPTEPECQPARVAVQGRAPESPVHSGGSGDHHHGSRLQLQQLL